MSRKLIKRGWLKGWFKEKPRLTIEEVGMLPDGSGFAVATGSLEDDHWLYKDDGFEAPPMPFKMGTSNPDRELWATKIRLAARYAVRASTQKGKGEGFDPDALVQNMVVGMLGYWSPSGLSDDEWANPKSTLNNTGDNSC